VLPSEGMDIIHMGPSLVSFWERVVSEERARPLPRLSGFPSYYLLSLLSAVTIVTLSAMRSFPELS
jgi:hypothetical protein